MENKRSDGKSSALKVLKWLFLIFLILFTLFVILFGINMYDMQSNIISEIVKCIDSGEFNKIGNIDRKGIVVNHHFLFYSFIISACSLTTIIIFLCISLRKTQKKLKVNFSDRCSCSQTAGERPEKGRRKRDGADLLRFLA